MAKLTRRMHVAAAIAAVSVITMATGIFYLRGGSTPVDVDSAVERFRATTQLAGGDEVHAQISREPKAQAAPAQPAHEHAPLRATAATRATTSELSGRPMPREGVYVYATTGGDDVDVLGGSRHSYPSRTTVTISRSDCGLVERWDALDERWDERETCRTAKGDELHRFTAYHEFFRHADQRTYTCTGYAYPAGAEPGDTWGGRCASGKSMTQQKARAIALETLVVAGKKVRTLHVRVETTLTGEQVGSSVHEVWGDIVSGVTIRERSTTDSDSTQPVFGKTHYHESYEINLVSLEPRS